MHKHLDFLMIYVLLMKHKTQKCRDDDFGTATASAVDNG